MRFRFALSLLTSNKTEWLRAIGNVHCSHMYSIDALFLADKFSFFFSLVGLVRTTDRKNDWQFHFEWHKPSDKKKRLHFYDTFDITWWAHDKSKMARGIIESKMFGFAFRMYTCGYLSIVSFYGFIVSNHRRRHIHTDIYIQPNKIHRIPIFYFKCKQIWWHWFLVPQAKQTISIKFTCNWTFRSLFE